MKSTIPRPHASGNAKKAPRRSRRRRIPVWARVALLVGLTLFAYQQYGYWSIPASARAAGTALRSSSVYVVPNEHGVIDAERARQVLGDRPILVAVLPADYPKRELAACEDVATQHPENLALVYVGAQSPAFCPGSKFPNPTTKGLDIDDWVFQVLLETEFASTYRVAADAHQRTPEVEEFALAFDALVRKDYADGVPKRTADPDPSVWWRVMLELAGLVIAAVGVFAAIRAAANRIIRLKTERAALRARRLDLQQKLSMAASEIMVFDPNEAPQKARLRAGTAEQYLHTLTEFEAARTYADLDAAQAGFTALATSVAELRRVPEKVPQKTHPARRRKWWGNR